MPRVTVLISPNEPPIPAYVAVSLLQNAAQQMGIQLSVYFLDDTIADSNLEQNVQSADLVFVCGDPVNSSFQVTSSALSISLGDIFDDAFGLLGKSRDIKGNRPFLVAVTSCPTGVAHTYLAAEALLNAAQQLQIELHVEKQGASGPSDVVSSEDIERAEVVIVAADIQIEMSRFKGKRVYFCYTKSAIKDPHQLINAAMKEGKRFGESSPSDTQNSATENPDRSPGSIYKHLLTGVSYMLPFVVSGGLLIALAFTIGGVDAAESSGTIAQALHAIGANSAMALMVPVLAGYISFSISDRVGLAPGMISGLVATNLQAGFLGGIIAGFVAGYIVHFLNRLIRLPKSLSSLKSTILLPFLGTLFSGLVIWLVLASPIAELNRILMESLLGMNSSSAVALGFALGAMMAVDMGGPVNKAAYTFATGLLISGVYGPMAAAMAAGMTPPLGLAMATLIYKKKFTPNEHAAAGATSLLGLSFITEGAIPYAARDPLRVIPALILGSASAGAISMYLGAELRVPHGGIFVLPIPNAVTNLMSYILALLMGTLITAVAIGVLKRNEL